MRFSTKKYMASNHDTFRKQSEWLRFVPNDLSDELLARANMFSVAENALVYDIGEELTGLHALISGVIAIRTDNTQAEVSCAHLMGPGAWLGEISVMTQGKSAIGVEAKTPCTLMVVPTGTLHALGNTRPDLWRALAVLAALNAKKALHVARDAMIRNPRERLIAVLDRFANEVGFDTQIPLTQEQLAEICNLSLRATSKILNQLVREEHVICGYRSIKVLN